MTVSWLKQVHSYLAADQSVCRIIIADAKGSTPREIGADMMILSDYFQGTIGGGRLEFEAIQIARNLIKQATSGSSEDGRRFVRHWQRFALGPSLGQCCGGSVLLMFEAYDPTCLDAVLSLSEQDATTIFHGKTKSHLPHPLLVSGDMHQEGYDPVAGSFIQSLRYRRPALYLYGAGHVGRAVMAVTSQLGFDRHWVDDEVSRFPNNPDGIGNDITIVPASDMTIIARHAPADSYHLVMTYSHRLDEAIVHAVLDENRFGRLGLIGSATKRQRFIRSLKSSGIDTQQLDRMVCPVGLNAIKGKAPERVALSIAAQLAVWLDEDEQERN